MRQASWLTALMVICAFALPARADDLDAPVLHHTPVASGAPGRKVTIQAHVTDASEVFPPSLSYRSVGEGRWNVVNMRGNKKGSFSAEIALNADTEYWIEVYDEYGNGPATSGSSERPHRIKAEAPVVVEHTPAPAPRPARPKPPEPAKDETPPVINHLPVEEALAEGPIIIEATITDPSGVFAPSVYYRLPGASSYESTSMATEQTGDVFVARVKAKPPFEYWLEAYDNFGNGPSRAGSPDAPFAVKLKLPEVPELVLAEPGRPPERSADEFDAPREIDRKWWIIGGSSVVGAAIVGGVIYALTSGPDYGAYLAAHPPHRRR